MRDKNKRILTCDRISHKDFVSSLIHTNVCIFVAWTTSIRYSVSLTSHHQTSYYYVYFFLWCFVKNPLYRTNVIDLENLETCIFNTIQHAIVECPGSLQGENSNTDWMLCAPQGMHTYQCRKPHAENRLLLSCTILKLLKLKIIKIMYGHYVYF